MEACAMVVEHNGVKFIEINFAKQLEQHSQNAVVYCVDDNEKCNCLLFSSIRSLKAHSSCDVYVMTIANNMYVKCIEALGAQVVLIDSLAQKWLDEDKLKNKNNVHAQSISTYYRLLMFKIKHFKKYSKLAYLDCDTLVYGDLDATLFRVKTNENGLAACPEVLVNRNQLSELCIFAQQHRIDISKMHSYFNAGVLLFDIDRIDVDKVFEKCIEYAPLNFQWHDQDILNCIFSDFTKIDSKFNLFNFTDRDYQNKECIIRHLTGQPTDKLRSLNSGKQILHAFKTNNKFPSIPKILHLIWIGKDVPKHVLNTVKAYKKLNPSFKINFVHEDDINNLKNPDSIECMRLATTDDGNNFYKMFHNSKNLINTKKFSKFNGIRFSDTLRFYLLHKYGGIYVDSDTFPIKAFDENLLMDEFFACRSFIGENHMNDDICIFDIFFIGSIPGNALFNYYKGYDESLGANYFELDKHYALYEYTDRNFEQYQSIGHDLAYVKKMHMRYFENCDLIPGCDRIHLKHDWKNEERNYYIDHYNQKTWLK